jgi:hypothetical protein
MQKGEMGGIAQQRCDLLLYNQLAEVVGELGHA